MRFGWCMGTGHHRACRVTIAGATGVLLCSCPCHDDEQEEAA